MRKNSLIRGCMLCMLLYLANCKQAYDPPAIQAKNNYLVVDGIINTDVGGVTTVNLNRTRNLGDTVQTGIPELNAQVTILSATGQSYPLQDTANTGIYSSQPLSLDNSQRYRIAVTTTDGRKYLSDTVSCKKTPPIDSLTWQQPHDLTFYITAHDPTANTRYYRWDYIETWEHDAKLQTPWGVSNGMIFPEDSSNQKFKCWTTVHSTGVLIDNSVAFAQDLIDQYPIEVIPNGDERVNKEYSILVRQYAITGDAYNYWLLIQKTSQNLGTLFDLQPTQLTGNIHCLTNPNEPVIGYLSACSMQQKRVLLYNADLTDWPLNSLVYGCDTLSIPTNPVNPLIYSYSDTLYAPYYFITGGPLVLASKICLDCTLLGGTNIRPSYWP